MLRRLSCVILAGTVLAGCNTQQRRDDLPGLRARVVSLEEQIRATTAREEETAGSVRTAQSRLNETAVAQTANSTELATALQRVRELQARGVSLEEQRRQIEAEMAKLTALSDFDRERLRRLTEELSAVNAEINRQEERGLNNTR